MADEQQINVPSLVVILVISGLIIRYFFSKPSSSSGGSGATAAGAGRRAVGARDPAVLARSREAAVERIQQMFPQMERRVILWDLQRTGGNIAATTERILAGRMESVRSFFPFSSFSPPYFTFFLSLEFVYLFTASKERQRLTFHVLFFF